MTLFTTANASLPSFSMLTTSVTEPFAELKIAFTRFGEVTSGSVLLANEVTESDLIAERPEAIRIAEALAVAVGVREGAPASHPASRPTS